MAGNGKKGDTPKSQEEAKAAEPEAKASSETEPETAAAAEADTAPAVEPDSDPTKEDARPALDDDPTIAQPPAFVTTGPVVSAPTIHDEDAIDTSHIDADDEDALHSVGMFLSGDAEHIDIDQMELPPEMEEPSFAQVAKNMTSWVIFVLTVGIAVGGALYINQQEELRIQVELLFAEEGLVYHKRAHIIALKERYAREDTYAQNRYGEFRMIYSPRDAEVSVTMYKYVENIGDFMTRYVKGMEEETRQLVEKRELKKFKQLTSNLKERQVVAEQNIKDLPVSSRTNPKDKEHPDRPKACTDDKEQYCTFVYNIKIEKEKYRPREFWVFSEYSLDPPALEFEEKKVQQLLFKNTGPGIYEVLWPGADLVPTPELFQEQFIRVMTDRLKCKLGTEDYTPLELKNFAALMELPEDDRWQKLADNGLLSHGPPAAKVWTLMEWKSSVAELKQPENIELWTSALQTIADCKCEEGVKCWGPDAAAAAAP